MGESILVAIISAGVPCIATIVSSLCQNRLSRKHAAKQSILQMCMEDQMSWEIFKKFPMNYGRIHDEYAEYSKNGGNGEVSKRVHEYEEWYLSIENSLKESRKEAK